MARHRREQAAALGAPRPTELLPAILYDLEALYMNLYQTRRRGCTKRTAKQWLHAYQT